MPENTIVLQGSTTIEASSSPQMFVRRNTRGHITSSSGFSVEEAGVVFVPGMRYKVTVEAIGEVPRLDAVWHADPVCRKGARKTLAMYKAWLTKPNFVAWVSGSQGSHATAKEQIPKYEGALQWSLGLKKLRQRIAKMLKAKKPVRVLDAETVKYHADSLITYILENEVDDFKTWFTDDGWDDAAVAKALGKKDISEDEAQDVISAIHAGNDELVDAIAYHAFGCDHIYTDAVQLDAFITGKVPKLTKAQVKKVLA